MPVRSVARRSSCLTSYAPPGRAFPDPGVPAWPFDLVGAAHYPLREGPAGLLVGNPSGTWPMHDRYPGMASRLRGAVLKSEGETDRSLRTAIEARAAGHGGRMSPAAEDQVPERLLGYVDKVALHAYRLTDADLESLRRDGYSQDEIFEITVSAALGAGIGRLERAYAALRGEV